LASGQPYVTIISVYCKLSNFSWMACRVNAVNSKSQFPTDSILLCKPLYIVTVRMENQLSARGCGLHWSFAYNTHKTCAAVKVSTIGSDDV